MHNSIQTENIQLAHLGLQISKAILYVSNLSVLYIFALFQIIQIACCSCVFASLDLSIYLLFNQKDKGSFNSL